MYDYIDEELIQDAVSYWMEDWPIESLKSHLPIGTKFNKSWSRETLEDIVYEYYLN